MTFHNTYKLDSIDSIDSIDNIDSNNDNSINDDDRMDDDRLDNNSPFYNNPFVNPFTIQSNNNLNNSPIINSFDMYKKKINNEFKYYIMNKFKDNNIYNIVNGKFLFKLRKLGNIKTFYDKIINPAKKLINSLEYYIHKNKLAVLIDKIILLMSDKGYFFDFDNYEYNLFELEQNLENNDINHYINHDINAILQEHIIPSLNNLYFIKIYNNKNKNIIDNNSFYKISMLLLHNNIILQYIS